MNSVGSKSIFRAALVVLVDDVVVELLLVDDELVELLLVEVDCTAQSQ